MTGLRLDQLPEDVLLKVVGFLGPERALAFGRSNRRLYQGLLQQDVFWQTLLVDGFPWMEGKPQALPAWADPETPAPGNWRDWFQQLRLFRRTGGWPPLPACACNPEGLSAVEVARRLPVEQLLLRDPNEAHSVTCWRVRAPETLLGLPGGGVLVPEPPEREPPADPILAHVLEMATDHLQLASPAGLRDYRSATVLVHCGSAPAGGTPIIHGWVLPETLVNDWISKWQCAPSQQPVAGEDAIPQDDEAEAEEAKEEPVAPAPANNQPAAVTPNRRFIVAWDGLVYPVVRLGAPEDPVKDAEALFKRDQKMAAERLQHSRRAYQRLRQPDIPERAVQYLRPLASVISRPWDLEKLSSLHGVMLHLAGLPELGTQLWKQYWDHSRLDPVARSRQVQFEFLWNRLNRAQMGHARGDDSLALYDFRAMATACRSPWVRGTVLSESMHLPVQERLLDQLLRRRLTQPLGDPGSPFPGTTVAVATAGQQQQQQHQDQELPTKLELHQDPRARIRLGLRHLCNVRGREKLDQQLHWDEDPVCAMLLSVPFEQLAPALLEFLELRLRTPNPDLDEEHGPQELEQLATDISREVAAADHQPPPQAADGADAAVVVGRRLPRVPTLLTRTVRWTFSVSQITNSEVDVALWLLRESGRRMRMPLELPGPGLAIDAWLQRMRDWVQEVSRAPTEARLWVTMRRTMAAGNYREAVEQMHSLWHTLHRQQAPAAARLQAARWEPVLQRIRPGSDADAAAEVGAGSRPPPGSESSAAAAVVAEESPFLYGSRVVRLPPQAPLPLELRATRPFWLDDANNSAWAQLDRAAEGAEDGEVVVTTAGKDDLTGMLVQQLALLIEMTVDRPIRSKRLGAPSAFGPEAELRAFVDRWSDRHVDPVVEYQLEDLVLPAQEVAGKREQPEPEDESAPESESKQEESEVELEQKEEPEEEPEDKRDQENLCGRKRPQASNTGGSSPAKRRRLWELTDTPTSSDWDFDDDSEDEPVDSSGLAFIRPDPSDPDEDLDDEDTDYWPFFRGHQPDNWPNSLVRRPLIRGRIRPLIPHGLAQRSGKSWDEVLLAVVRLMTWSPVHGLEYVALMPWWQDALMDRIRLEVEAAEARVTYLRRRFAGPALRPELRRRLRAEALAYARLLLESSPLETWALAETVGLRYLFQADCGEPAEHEEIGEQGNEHRGPLPELIELALFQVCRGLLAPNPSWSLNFERFAVSMFAPLIKYAARSRVLQAQPDFFQRVLLPGELPSKNRALQRMMLVARLATETQLLLVPSFRRLVIALLDPDLPPGDPLRRVTYVGTACREPVENRLRLRLSRSPPDTPQNPFLSVQELMVHYPSFENEDLPEPPLAAAPSLESRISAAEWLGLQLSWGVCGLPGFSLFWPTERRDRVLQEMRLLLQQHGDALRPADEEVWEASTGESDPIRSDKRVRFVFQFPHLWQTQQQQQQQEDLSVPQLLNSCLWLHSDPWVPPLPLRTSPVASAQDEQNSGTAIFHQAARDPGEALEPFLLPRYPLQARVVGERRYATLRTAELTENVAAGLLGVDQAWADREVDPHNLGLVWQAEQACSADQHRLWDSEPEARACVEQEFPEEADRRAELETWFGVVTRHGVFQCLGRELEFPGGLRWCRAAERWATLAPSDNLVVSSPPMEWSMGVEPEPPGTVSVRQGVWFTSNNLPQFSLGQPITLRLWLKNLRASGQLLPMHCLEEDGADDAQQDAAEEASSLLQSLSLRRVLRSFGAAKLELLVEPRPAHPWLKNQRLVRPRFRLQTLGVEQTSARSRVPGLGGVRLVSELRLDQLWELRTPGRYTLRAELFGSHAMIPLFDLQGGGRVQQLEAELNRCAEVGLCTFAVSGLEYVRQEWWYCATCGQGDRSMGCCGACARACHAGHDIRVAPNGASRFFCDCGSGDLPVVCCRLAKLEPEELENRPRALYFQSQF